MAFHPYQKARRLGDERGAAISKLLRAANGGWIGRMIIEAQRPEAEACDS
jgi:hypothetical protein